MLFINKSFINLHLIKSDSYVNISFANTVEYGYNENSVLMKLR